MNESILLAAAIGVAALAIVAIVAIPSRGSAAALIERFDELTRNNERLERELRTAVETSAAALRIETGARLGELQTGLVQQVTGLGGLQGQQLMGFGQQVSKVSEMAVTTARMNREESAQQLKDFGAGMQQQLADLTRAIQLNLTEVRNTLQGQLSALQQGKFNDHRQEFNH